MNREKEKKELIKKLKGCDNYLVTIVVGNACGCGCCGDGAAIMGMLSTISSQLYKNGMPKDLIIEAINVGFMNDKELKEYEEKQLKDIEKIIKK